MKIEHEPDCDQLALYLRTVPDALVAVSLPDRRLLYASAAFEQICGFPPERLNENPDYYLECVYPVDRPAFAAAQLATLNDGFAEVDHRLRLPDGQVRWLHARMWVTGDDQGQPIQFNYTAHDITARKQGEFELQTNEERYRALSEGPESAVLIVDSSGVLLFASEAAGRLLDQKPEKMVGESVSDLVPGKLGKTCLRNLQRVIKSGKEIAGKRAAEEGKQSRWRLVSTQPIRARDETVVAALFRLMGVTPVAQADQVDEDQTRVFTDSQTGYVLRTDLDGRYESWNHNFEQDYGWIHGEKGTRGANSLESIMDYHHQRTLDAVARCLASPGTVVRVELDKPWKTGGVHTTLWEFVGLTNAKGEPVAIQCAGIDITDRVRAEAALRASEDQFQRFMRHLPGSVYVMDADGRVIYCNGRHARMWGRMAAEIIGANMRDYMPAETAREVAEENAQVLREDRAIDVHFEVEEEQGVTRWLATKFPIVRDGQPPVVGAVAIEVTREWQAEVALRASEAQYRLLADNIADVVWILDTRTQRFTYVSPSVEQLRGYTPEEVMRQSLDEVLAPDSLALVRGILPSRMAAFLAGDKTARIQRHEIEQMCRDGSTVWTEVVTRLLQDEQGNLHILGVSRDISERKRTQDALQASEERLRTILRGVPDLMFRVSADYRFIDYFVPSEKDLFAPPSQFLGKRIDELFPPDLAPGLLAAHERAHAAQEPVNFEYVLPDHGVHREFELRILPQADGTALSIVRDITERRRTEERIRRLNRTLSVLSRVNEAVARIRDIPALFEHVCRIAVEEGGLRMAWVGMVDSSRRCVPVASAGAGTDYLETVDIRVDNSVRSRGPTGYALRTGQHTTATDIASDSRMRPWRKRALEYGYRSSASFPLRVGGQVRGALTLYASTPGFFDEQELRLLDDLADNLSFAMEFAEQEARRRETEAALRASEDQFQRFMRHLPAEVGVYEGGGRILFANDLVTAAFGNPAGGVIGRNIGDFLPAPLLADALKENLQVLAEDRVLTFQYRSDKPTGTTHWLATKFPIPREGQPKAVGVIAIDITRQVQAETALRASEEQFQRFMRYAPGEVVIFDEDGTVLYGNEAMARAINHPLEEVVGRNIRELRPSETAEDILRQNAEVLAADRVLEFPYQRTSPEGVTHWQAIKFPIPREGASRAIGVLALDVTREQEVEAALRASQEQFQAFMQHLPAAVWIVDEADRYIYVNDFYASLNGHVAAGMVGKYVHECLPPEKAEAYNAENALVRSRGHALDFTGIRQSPDDETSYWMVTKFPIHREDRPPLIGGVSMDVTKERRAERVLQEAHDQLERRVQERTVELERAMDRLEAIFNHSGDGIVLLHTDEGIEQANASFDELFGSAPGAHVGQLLREQFLPDYRDAIGAAIAEVIATHQSRQVEAEVQRSDGVLRMVELSLSPINRSGRAVTHLVCILRDVTERKQLEAALAEQLRELERFFSISLDLMCIADMDTRFIKLNNTWESVLGYPLDQLEGRSFLEFIHPDDLQTTVDQVGTLSDQNPVLNFINRYRAYDGEYRVLEWHAMPYGDKIYAAARDVTERIQFEEDLRASEQLYRTTLATMSEGLIVRSADGEVQFCNEAAERITGLTVAQMRHDAPEDPSWRSFTEDGRTLNEDERPSLTSLRTGASIANLILGVDKPDGGQSWMLINANALKDEQGQVVTSVTTLTDITRLKQAQAELQQKHTDELRMQAYLKGLHQITVELTHLDSLDDFYRQTVELGKQIFGFERMGLMLYDPVTGGGKGTYGTDLAGRTVNEHDMIIAPEAMIEPIQRILHQRERFIRVEQSPLFVGNEVVSTGEQAVAALWDGEALGWISVDNAIRGQPLSQPQMEILALYAVTVGSLLARKHSEQRALALSQRLELATRAGGIGIWDWNLATDDMYWDEGMAHLYGLTPNDLNQPGNPYARFIHPEDWPRVSRSLDVTELTDDEHEQEFRIIRADGSIRYIRSQALLLRDDQGAPQRVIGVNLDITRIKLAEQTLLTTLAKEKELGELKTRFVSMASHEFRTPLATILATTETLSIYRNRMNEDQVDARLDKIRQQVAHLKEVMDDVLQLARMQAGRAEYTFVRDDLHALCLEIVEEFQSQAEYRGRLHYQRTGGGAVLRFDRKHMRHVIVNLVHNALKYSGADKPVDLHLNADDQRVTLTVQDQGIGIAPGDLEHLFEPFHRGTNVGMISGTGLGLSIARQAIEAHQGELNVESQLNVGTTFTLVVPINPDMEGGHA